MNRQLKFWIAPCLLTMWATIAFAPPVFCQPGTPTPPATPAPSHIETIAESATKVGANFESYLATRIIMLGKARMKTPAETLKEKFKASKQVDTPTIGDNSTSLTDKGSAGDFVSLAFQLAGLTNNDAKSNNASVSITAFALKAFLDGRNPSGTSDEDLKYYRDNSRYRRFTFTLGTDSPEAGNPRPKATLLGAKIVLIPSDKNGTSELDNDDWIRISRAFQKLSQQIDPVLNKVDQRIIPMLGANSPFVSTAGQKPVVANELVSAFVNNQRPDGTPLISAEIANVANVAKAIDEEINTALKGDLGHSFDLYQQLAAHFANKVPKQKQLTLDLQTKQKSGGTSDDYKANFLYEIGSGGKSNLVLNAGYMKESDGVTRKRGGVFAAEFQRIRGSNQQANSTATDKPEKPAQRLSFSALADMAAPKDIYKAQLKWVIPLKRGIEIPISVTVANRTELITEGKIKGKIGFTFDLSKLGLDNP